MKEQDSSENDFKLVSYDSLRLILKNTFKLKYG